MTCVPEETATKKGVCLCVYECVWLRSRACCKSLSTECSCNGISCTRRAQMTPKSSESFWKGHTQIQESHLLTHLSTAAYRFLGLVSARAFSLSSILWMLHNHSFQVCNREQNRNAFKMSNGSRSDLLSLMRSQQWLNSIKSFRGKQILTQLFCYDV